jgi:hypothetical protein
VKIDLRLPGGGELHFEKEPMDSETRGWIIVALFFFGFLGFMLLLFLILT